MTPIKGEDGKFPAYVWPGGYQLLYFVADGGTLCPDCANGAHRSEASIDHDEKQWQLIAVDVYWEGPALQCDHCNTAIESAYGDPDASDDE